MKVSVSFLVLFFILSSCQDIEPVEKPSDLIPEKKMVNVLTDLSLLHGARSYDKRTLERTGLHPDRYLFEKYDIDSVQFARSNTYYAANPEIYLHIYDSVRARLEALKEKYTAIKEEKERIADSLREAEKDSLASLKNTGVQDSLRELDEKKTLPPAVSSKDSIL